MRICMCMCIYNIKFQVNLRVLKSHVKKSSCFRAFELNFDHFLSPNELTNDFNKKTWF